MKWAKRVIRWGVVLAAVVGILVSIPLLLLTYGGDQEIDPLISVAAGGWYVGIYSHKKRDDVIVIRDWPGRSEISVRLFSPPVTDYVFTRDELTGSEIWGMKARIGRTHTLVDDTGRPVRYPVNRQPPLGMPESESMGFRQIALPLLSIGAMLLCGSLLVLALLWRLSLTRDPKPSERDADPTEDDDPPGREGPA